MRWCRAGTGLYSGMIMPAQGQGTEPLPFASVTELLIVRNRRTPQHTALRSYREGQWRPTSYRSLYRAAAATAAFLSSEEAGSGAPAALMLGRTHQWPEIFFGASWVGPAVPIDPQLPEDEMLHILRDSGSGTVFTDAEHLPLLLEAADTLHALRRVIVCNAGALPENHGRSRLAVTRYEELTGEGGLSPEETPLPRPEDTAAIIYTSGTTGRPHGVVLTHRNIAANVRACLTAVHVEDSDHFGLLLPLHHSFALTANLLVPIAAGVPVSLVRSLRTLLSDLQQIRPTILLMVPLMLYKLRERTEHELRRSWGARFLSRLPGFSRLVGRRLLRQLGGRVRMIVVGGSACDPEVLWWCRRCGIPVIEGYGLTEAGPVLTLNPPDRPRIGSVGRALPGVEIRIADAGDDGVGEIIARGESIAAQYHNDPEATAATFREGWLYTGDLGYLDADGYLYITGRRKNLIVTAGGKNIHPEEVETVIARSRLIAEVLAMAESDNRGPRAESLAVTVVPRMEALDELAEKRGKPFSDQEIEQLLREEVRRLTDHLPVWKRPRRIRIRYEPFEKTATGKIKRFLYR